MYNIIEKAIIDKVKTAVPELRTVKGYEGDFNKNTLMELLGLTPFALVVYEGSDLERHNTRKVRKMKWTIFIGAKSVKKGIARPQVYELLEKLENCLDQYQVAGSGTTPLEIRAERFFYRDSQLVVYEQSYITKIMQ